MNNKPIYYIEAIKLIKHIALKGDSILSHQSLSENVCPWTTLKYRDLTITINIYYHMIYVGKVLIKATPLSIKNHIHHRPLRDLDDYLYKIFNAKDERKQKYIECNSLEAYNKHLNLMKKNHEPG